MAEKGVNARYSGFIRRELLALTTWDKEDITVLDIGCAAGGNLVEIKSMNPTAHLHGIEFDEKSAAVAGEFGSVEALDIERVDRPQWQNKFDRIILADVLEHLKDPYGALKNVATWLAPHGRIIISLPNVLHASVFLDMLRGTFNYADAGILDRTHLRFFGQKDMLRMIQSAGLKIKKTSSSNFSVYPEEKELAAKLLTLSAGITPEDLAAYQWFFVCAHI